MMEKWFYRLETLLCVFETFDYSENARVLIEKEKLE